MRWWGWWRQQDRFSVRVAHMRDAPALARLHAACFPRPWHRQDFETMLADPVHLGHVLCLGGRRRAPVLGFVLSRLVAPEAELISVAVDPAWRQQGGARLLLRAHLQMLAARGMSRVFLEVEEESAAALALYRRLGFRQISRREGYYPAADGTRSAALVFRLDLV